MLAFDQGTSGSRSVIFDGSGCYVSNSKIAHRQIYPAPGWVSHDPVEIFRNTVESAYQAIGAADIKAGQIEAIGVTNQRETLVAWDSETGAPVCDAVVWQCNRTAEYCERIKKDGMEREIGKRTGLVADPYFSATKIKWVLDNVPEAGSLMAKGRLKCGTVDSYLIYRLSGNKRHITDYTNASRTMLFNINTLEWDAELLRYFGIPEAILPEVVPSSCVSAHTDRGIFGMDIPIAGIAGDQHAALFGQTCFNRGDVKNTYGTGCFVLKNTGDTPVYSENGLLTTIAYHVGGKAAYALEGSVFTAGAAVEWLIRETKLIKDVDDLQAACEKVPDTGGVFFVPAFTGLGAPHWDTNARGSVFGMTLSTSREHIARAVMESIAYQSRDVIETMDMESGFPVDRLRADGGVSKSDFVMQFQADILGKPVERPAYTETTALGAAYLAGLGCGLFEGFNSLSGMREVGRTFTPEGGFDEGQYAMWLKAVEKSRGWA